MQISGTTKKRRKPKKILICKSRDLSYGSSGYFLQQIALELQNRGNLVEYFELQERLANIDDLERYVGHTYDAVLDINSWLPQMVLEDDTCLLDYIHAPFFNYIVDHPLHLPGICSCEMDHLHLICLDDSHRQYIRQYYPQIQDCHVLPLAASVPEVCKPYRERSMHIFFPGTYMPLIEYTEKLKRMGGGCADLAEEYVQQYLADPAIPDIPTWYQMQYPDAVMSGQRISIQCHYIDRYLREYLRHNVLESILAEGYRIHVTGEHWEYYDGKYSERLVIHPSCDYSAMLEQIGDSQVVLNVQPLFPHAPHDRILCAMAGGAVALTDSCTYMKQHLEAGRQYLCYDPRKPERSIRNLRRYLDQPERLEEIALQGKRWIDSHYLWSDWVSRFLDLVDSAS